MRIIENGDRVLLVSPHPDDFEFGCGGTIHRYRNKITTRLLVLSNRMRTRGEKNNEEQQRKAAEILGCHDIQFFDLYIRMFGSTENRDILRKTITDEVISFKPDAIFFPSPREVMQDHQAVADEIIRVVRSTNLIAYEVPKHTRFFNPNVFVQIYQEDLDAKMNALNCFTEQAGKFYFSPDVLRAMAIFRAATTGITGFVEGFELYHYLETADLTSASDPKIRSSPDQRNKVASRRKPVQKIESKASPFVEA
jgi:LmbE family N-acetylglucosaminyl deacetylase